MGTIIKSTEIYRILNSINEALDPELERRLRKDLRKYCEETGHDYLEICKVAKLDPEGFENISSDVIELLNYATSKWSYNEKTGRIDVMSNFEISLYKYGKFSSPAITLPILREIEFGEITGDFTITGMGLTDEDFEKICPLEVTGNFSVYNNSLTRIILPRSVGKGISLAANKIESLDGCPELVDGDFNVNGNQLRNLVGGPKIVNGYNCSNQSIGDSIFTLEGCAEIVNGDFNCTGNSLRTFEGGPTEIKGRLLLNDNYLSDLKGNLKKFGGRHIDLTNNRLVSLEGLPLNLQTWNIEISKNLIPHKVIKETYQDASKMNSWIAAYLKLAATQRFKRMGKKERDPIVSRITPEILAKNPVALAPIWKDSELLNDPVIKRRMKQSGISKNDSFKNDVDLVSDLLDLGF